MGFCLPPCLLDVVIGYVKDDLVSHFIVSLFSGCKESVQLLFSLGLTIEDLDIRDPNAALREACRSCTVDAMQPLLEIGLTTGGAAAGEAAGGAAAGEAAAGERHWPRDHDTTTAQGQPVTHV